MTTPTIKVPVRTRTGETLYAVLDADMAQFVTGRALTLDEYGRVTVNVQHPRRRRPRGDRRSVRLALHRLVLGLPIAGSERRYVKHADGDALNLQRSNLQLGRSVPTSPRFSAVDFEEWRPE